MRYIVTMEHIINDAADRKELVNTVLGGLAMAATLVASVWIVFSQ